jgi:hypothetical protein
MLFLSLFELSVLLHTVSQYSENRWDGAVSSLLFITLGAASSLRFSNLL